MPHTTSTTSTTSCTARPVRKRLRPVRRRHQPSKRSTTEEAIAVAIAALVAAAPPLSRRTRARLAELFSVTCRTPR